MSLLEQISLPTHLVAKRVVLDHERRALALAPISLVLIPWKLRVRAVSIAQVAHLPLALALAECVILSEEAVQPEKDRVAE